VTSVRSSAARGRRNLRRIERITKESQTVSNNEIENNKMNTPHPFTFHVSYRLDGMVKRRPDNPFRRKKNEPAPNRTHKRSDNAGTMNVPAAFSSVQPAHPPVLPPAQLVVCNVDIVVASDNCCPSLKRNAPIADNDGFDFGNFGF
jgi:hypothetical protein